MIETGPLENAADLRGTIKRLRRLVDLSVTLNSTLNPDELLQLIIRTAAELLDCEAASILLYDEQHGQLRFAASTGSDPQQLAKIPVPLEGSLAGTIFRENRPLILNNVRGDPRHYTAVAQQVHFEARSLVGVPMRVRERVTGVLEALNKRRGTFDEADERILSVIAAHAAVAIQNAQLMQALRAAYEHARQADERKNTFLALASHELRTPLGIIIGYASFLREDAQGETSEHAERVLGAALQMRALIEDMTNLTLLERDGLIFRPAVQPVQAILEAAYAEVEEMVQAREQRVHFEMPAAPLPVWVDQERTCAALVNVLNNAVRFSPNGGVILVGAKRVADGVLAWVQDHGIGIAPDQLLRIFEPFYQVEPYMTRRSSGLGIGLAISKGLIEAQGGKIWAESDGPGKGATFKILLPAA